MDHDAYKKLHEGFMTNNTGSTPLETGVVLSAIPVAVFLSLSASPFLYQWLIPLSEFAIIIWPIVLSVTVLSSHVFVIPYQMLLFAIFIFSWNLVQNCSNVKQILNEKLPEKKGYITNYRASTNIVSVLCILAVDFVAFPRKFAKTETYGFGLMDLGVGFFVCSNGMVVKKLDASQSIWKVVKSASILIILGLIRLVSTKAVDYNVPVSEYGTHWNFFFTLASCKIGAHIIMSWSRLNNPFLLFVIIAVVHETCLELGVKDWIFSNIPRQSFISANREGLGSLLGYIALYFGAVSLGRIVNPTNKSLTRMQLLQKLTLYCVFSWFICHMANNYTGVSRCLANLGYISWIISLTITKLIQFMVWEVILLATQSTNVQFVPNILEAINRNGLLYFLLGNLLTGLINLKFQTLLLKPLTSIVIISCYVLILSIVTYALHLRNIAIKYW